MKPQAGGGHLRTLGREQAQEGGTQAWGLTLMWGCREQLHGMPGSVAADGSPLSAPAPYLSLPTKFPSPAQRLQQCLTLPATYTLMSAQFLRFGQGAQTSRAMGKWNHQHIFQRAHLTTEEVGCSCTTTPIMDLSLCLCT